MTPKLFKTVTREIATSSVTVFERAPRSADPRMPVLLHTCTGAPRPTPTRGRVAVGVRVCAPSGREPTGFGTGPDGAYLAGEVAPALNRHGNPRRTPGEARDRKVLTEEEIFREVLCHNCAGSGHYQKDCPSPRMSRPSKSIA